MHMLSERLQILVRPDQRRRLEAEARRRGTSVGALVREAVDAKFAYPTREQRIKAVDEIGAMNANGPFYSPEELNRIIDEEFEAEARRLHYPGYD